MISPKNTQYLFIDMNAFFASCEQQRHPEYRHKPVAVTPVAVPTGCIISPSYEAKAYGIKTGTMVRDAKKLCPQVALRESDVVLYFNFHQKLVQILSQFSPFLVVKSVDEAVIKLSPNEQNSNKAKDTALAIKNVIREKLGKYLRASIGIGPNVWLAKMAAESEKPDGLVELKLTDLPAFYQSSVLTDLKGINWSMTKQLNQQGIFKPLELYLSSAEDLRQKFGIIGEYWYLRMHGYDIDRFSSRTKTIGHSHVLEPKMRIWSKAWAVCQKLVERAGKRLRKERFMAGGVCLWIRYLGKLSWHKGIKTAEFSDSQTFLKAIARLWQEAPKDHLPLGMGIRAYNLTKSVNFQPKLFSKMQKTQDLYRAVDQINDLYGSFTIKPANILLVESAAPIRIAFGKPLRE